MYEELKKLAEAATPGPWGYDGSYVCPSRVEGGTTYVESWKSVADCHQPENTKFIAAANPSAVLALIAESERVNAAWHEMKIALDQLKAENEALKKDAERYRFIRDADRSDGILDVDDLGLYAMESLDEVVDEAMSREGEVRQ